MFVCSVIFLRFPKIFLRSFENRAFGDWRFSYSLIRSAERPNVRTKAGVLLDRKINENDNQTQANIFDGHRVFCDDHDII